MIAGATYTLPIDIQYPLGNVSKVIVTLKNETTQQKILKNYPNDNETYLMSDGRLGVRLSQQDTISLVGNVKVEAQINLASGAVAKTETKRVFVSPTLHTEIVDGAADNGENLLDGVTLELGAPITAEGEGTSFQPGNALELKDGILNVLTTDDAEKGNNLPITSEGARKLADNISYNDLKDRPFYETEEIFEKSVIAPASGESSGRALDLEIAQAIFDDYTCATITFFNGTFELDGIQKTYSYKIVYGVKGKSSYEVHIGLTDGELNGEIGWNHGGYDYAPQAEIAVHSVKREIKKLDKKFLPDDVATKADIIGAMEVGY